MDRQRASKRMVWAVDSMNIQPYHRLLEIGYGHGVAVSLICERLNTGIIVAVDRSPKMIELAKKRNLNHINAGLASFQAVSLLEADVDNECFDKIFAFNVGLFWHWRAFREFELIKNCIAPNGEFYFFYQSPNLQKQPSAGSLPSILKDNGFIVQDVVAMDLETARVGYVLAEKR